MKNIVLILVLMFMMMTSVFAEDGVDEAVIEHEGIDIPVLIYHHIDDDPTWDGVVTKEKYRDDMITLKDAGYEAVFLTDIVDYLNGYIELPEKPIVITFDDGYLSNYEYAFGIAKETDMKFTVFMIGWSVGRTTFINTDKPITPHFTWKQAMEMYSSGLVDLQNHTYDLHSPQGLSYGYGVLNNIGVLPMQQENYKQYFARISYDLLKLNMEMFLNTGHVPTFVAYPYTAYNAESERVVSNLNMGTVSAYAGVRSFKTLDDLREIPRLNVSMDLSGDILIKRIEGLQNK